MTFSRTDFGKVATFRFLTKPLIWVEGPEDVEMFSPLARRFGCIFRSAEGKRECAKLIRALQEENHAYAVLIDGDYSVVMPVGRIHRRIILLRKYSAENYLYVEDAVRQFCMGILRHQDDADPLASVMSDFSDTLEQQMKHLVILDIARDLSDSDVAILPHRMDELFESRDSLRLSPASIQVRIDRGDAAIKAEIREQARVLLDRYLATNRFVDALNGHLILGVIRRILHVLSRRAGVHFSADDKMLRLSLAGLVWHRRTSWEHRRVMDRIRNAVSEIRRIRGI